MSDAVVGERAIRVFVSSTFRDMQAEREELVKRVFPQVRRRCEERGVAWSEVDLRWGVTDEQKAEGAVLPICLAEIDRSRPYFIGLLGQRYGWIPEELPAGLADQLPWLGERAGTSVTELEVLHGVLHDPEAAGHAFFHLRDPAWVDTRPPEERRILGELPSDEEVAALGPAGAEAAAAERRARLEDLKDRVRGSGHPCADYRDPQDLGRQVLAELLALVDRLFPADEAPDALDRDAAAHHAYGAARRRGLLERPELAARLDAHVAAATSPLLVSAPPGSDVTPLVAAWLDDHRAAHPDDVVVQHHVGATSDAAGWPALAARLVGELGRGHGLEALDAEALPDDPAGRRAALFAALAQAGDQPRRTVVVVDGVDLLTDVDGAPDLTWLPLLLPAGVRVVLTTSGPRPTAEAQRRGWPTLAVPPLTEAERRAFTTTFLARWSKGLDEVHLARLVAAPQTGNVLFLRTVLDELRQHGDHFTLGDVIDRLLGAETVDDLLELVLARYEADFEDDRPGLVGDAFRALWAARRGLTEPELLGLLGDVAGGGEPVIGAIWSPLVLAAEAGLVTRSGLLGFATDVHRQAVEDRYLPDDEAKRSAHAAVARAFAAEPLGPRVVDELAWQQLGAGDLDGVVATISDPAYLDLAYPLAPSDLRRLWARAEAAGRSVVDGYRPIIEDPAAHAAQVWAVARLVTDAGHPVEALALHRFLVGHHRAGTDGTEATERTDARLRASLVNLGAALYAQGDLDGAEGPLREAVDRSRAAEDRRLLAAALGDLALCRRDRGDLPGASLLFVEEQALCRALGDARGLQASLGNHASALRAGGDHPQALVLLAEAESISRAIGDTEALGFALVGKAALLGDVGDPQGALDQYRAFRATMEEAGNLRAMAEGMVGEANTLRQLGRHAEAEVLANECEAIARRLDDEPMLARILDARARTAIDEARWADAQRLAQEAALTARSADAPAVLTLALGSLGMAQREQGDLVGARATHTEEERVAEANGLPGSVATAQVNLAAVDIASNDLPAALARYALAEPVLRGLGLAMTLVPLLNNRWQVHNVLGDDAAAIADLIDCGAQCALAGGQAQRQQVLTKAVELLYGTGRMAEAEPVWADLADACRQLGDQAGLQRALGEGALLVLGRGDVATASAMFAEQEAICRATGDQVGLAACVGNQAIVLRQQGDLSGALAKVEEQIALARASGNGQGYLFGTANRGELLGLLGRFDEGLAALTEARTMAATHGLTPMVEQLDQMIASVRSSGN